MQTYSKRLALFIQRLEDVLPWAQERRRRKYWSSYAANVQQGQLGQLHGNAAQMAALNNVIGGQNR